MDIKTAHKVGKLLNQLQAIGMLTSTTGPIGKHLPWDLVYEMGQHARMIVQAELITLGVEIPADQVVRDTKQDKIDNLIDVVEQCRDQFEFYRQQHMFKMPPAPTKAFTNQEFRDLCNSAIDAAKSED